MIHRYIRWQFGGDVMIPRWLFSGLLMAFGSWIVFVIERFV
jgi:hypothetical protein